MAGSFIKESITNCSNLTPENAIQSIFIYQCSAEGDPTRDVLTATHLAMLLLGVCMTVRAASTRAVQRLSCFCASLTMRPTASAPTSWFAGPALLHAKRPSLGCQHQLVAHVLLVASCLRVGPMGEVLPGRAASSRRRLRGPWNCARAKYP